jgi:hypothetical protein
MSRRRLAAALGLVVTAFAVVNVTGVASAAVTNVLIKGAGSGRCLTPPASDGATTYIQDCAGQLWSTTSSKQITINGKCLDASGGGVANGTVVTVWTCNGGSNQAWNVNANGTVTGVGSGRCLDVFGQLTANGTKVELWDCNGGSNQAWQLVNSGGGNGGPSLTGFSLLRDYEFGTGAGRNTSNLATAFHPRATSGSTPPATRTPTRRSTSSSSSTRRPRTPSTGPATTTAAASVTTTTAS